jgi:hypothetical protein
VKVISWVIWVRLRNRVLLMLLRRKLRGVFEWEGVYHIRLLFSFRFVSCVCRIHFGWITWNRINKSVLFFVVPSVSFYRVSSALIYKDGWVGQTDHIWHLREPLRSNKPIRRLIPPSTWHARAVDIAVITLNFRLLHYAPTWTFNHRHSLINSNTTPTSEASLLKKVRIPSTKSYLVPDLPKMHPGKFMRNITAGERDQMGDTMSNESHVKKLLFHLTKLADLSRKSLHMYNDIY